MEASRSHSSLADKSNAVKASLIQTVALVQRERSNHRFTPQVPHVVDVLERFKLWAGNLGAFLSPKSKLSLDARLIDAPEVRDQIAEHLDDLQEAIDDLLGIIEDTKPAEDSSQNGSDAEGDEDEDVGPGLSYELSVLLDVMSQCLHSLFRIAVFVRKATTTDRFDRALQKSDEAFSASFDIDFVEHKHPKLDAPDKRWLAKRLGTGIAKRRQVIRYFRSHKVQLEQEPEVEVTLTERVASTKATTLVLPLLLANNDNQNMIVVDEDDAVSLDTASTAFDAENRLKLPTLADLSPDGRPFECPICFTLQTFRREKAWRVHAFSDLKAYQCTVGGKDCESELFRDRSAWFNHEVTQHRSQYICGLCADTSFASKMAILSHLKTDHGDLTDEQCTLLAESNVKIPTSFKAQDCPFCNDWAQTLAARDDSGKGKGRAQDATASNKMISAARFKRHVATHMEQLAIFAVPRSSGCDGSQRSGSMHSMSPLGSLTTFSGISSNKEVIEKNICPYPDCGKVVKDLKAHMLTHQTERPEKCPIETCEYHIMGFARRYDRNRHVLSHYRGPMVCSFCPGIGSPSEKSFNRADVFKRHLTSVHGVEQKPPRKRSKVLSGVNIGEKFSSYSPDATGKCSTCSKRFANAQDFYEHLDDCVLRIVQQDSPAEAVNAQSTDEASNMTNLSNKLPEIDYSGWTTIEKRAVKMLEIATDEQRHSARMKVHLELTTEQLRWVEAKDLDLALIYYLRHGYEFHCSLSDTPRRQGEMIFPILQAIHTFGLQYKDNERGPLVKPQPQSQTVSIDETGRTDDFTQYLKQIPTSSVTDVEDNLHNWVKQVDQPPVALEIGSENEPGATETSTEQGDPMIPSQHSKQDNSSPRRRVGAHGERIDARPPRDELFWDLTGARRDSDGKQDSWSLPKETTDKLRSWLLAHPSHPNPTEDEKKELMRQTGLRMNQVSSWFINEGRKKMLDKFEVSLADYDALISRAGDGIKSSTGETPASEAQNQLGEGRFVDTAQPQGSKLELKLEIGDTEFVQEQAMLRKEILDKRTEATTTEEISTSNTEQQLAEERAMDSPQTQTSRPGLTQMERSPGIQPPSPPYMQDCHRYQSKLLERLNNLPPVSYSTDWTGQISEQQQRATTHSREGGQPPSSEEDFMQDCLRFQTQLLNRLNDIQSDPSIIDRAEQIVDQQRAAIHAQPNDQPPPREFMEECIRSQERLLGLVNGAQPDGPDPDKASPGASIENRLSGISRGHHDVEED